MNAFSTLAYTVLRNRVYFLLALTTVVTVAMSLLSPYFFTTSNLLGMTRFGAVLALVALGETLVILAGGGGIDLSVGAMVSLTGVIIGLLAQDHLNVVFACLLGVLAGAGLGAINGLLVTGIGLPPLIATLGTWYVYGAVALVLTNGQPISSFPGWFGHLGQGDVLGVPAQVLFIVLPVYLVLQFIVSKTIFGREIYLIGGNALAAQLSGIRVGRTRFLLYTLSGLLAGLGGIIMCSWLLTARPDVGTGLELQAITVAVLGGTDIFGGAGTLGGSMTAVLIVTMVYSGLQLANVNSVWQLGVLGGLLLVAVGINQAIASLALRRRRSAAT